MILGLGTEEINTKRLILRKFRTGDAEQAFHNWTGNPQVTKYLRWQAHTTVARTEAVIANWERQYEDPYYYHWAVVLRDSGTLIGGINIDAKDKMDECGELGYSIGEDFWSNGYISEAVGAVLLFGFAKVGFNRIEGCCAVENTASSKVLMRAGMQYEGRLRQLCRISSGKFADCNVYAVLAEDYFKTHNFVF